ncbi:uncharacterized protein LOC123539244 [Mercenaria mercenaria]|uniref:uncharacterized protein LOC123539244 n=1 Tax=Mercenaria mercenaria TaxID=6596 RepID=UPI00234F5F35|nr:uncharacterized protein LOC123539244 [Mercenaria mercenaria]
MKSHRRRSSRNDDDGYEADDEDSECSIVSSSPQVSPPHDTFTFSQPEVPVILLQADGQLISSDPNNNNNRSILDQGRGKKRKLDENGIDTHAPKRQKRYHVYGGPIKGVKRTFQGEYSVQDFKRMKLSPEENVETWLQDNMQFLSNSLSDTEIGGDFNTTYSATSLLASVSMPTYLDRDSPYKNTKLENDDKNNISENEATPCPSRCKCSAIVDTFMQYLREEAKIKVYDTPYAVSRECDHPNCELAVHSSASALSSVSLPAVNVRSTDLSAPVNVVPEPEASIFVKYLREQAKCKVFDAYTRKSENLEEWVYISVEPEPTYDILLC